jgi:DNA-binding NarL/FixJ family response regulator
MPPSSGDSRENPDPLRKRCATIRGVRKRVLIVDDHQPFRAVARELLESAGYIVAGEAADAAQALAAVAADAPDAVLLDVQLPDRDGFAVASALAAADGPAVVLISSREADDYGRRVTACGARGFIPKSKLSAATFAALLE